MTYLLIKSLHVCAIVVWIAGMVLQALALHPELRTSTLLRRWDRLATAPAMLLAWVTGMFLATRGGWFGDRWLFAKLTIVVALSAMHGMLAGRLRRQMESQATRSQPPLKFLLPTLLAMTAGIALLVIAKPF